ncbi:MAG: hypothetical protein L6R28_00660 [Planctomycetes bacterium]|nr:hypothetical protein [Planctomycetota bacterium]
MELDKKYAEQGLHIVGLECQGSTKDEIVAIASARGAKYQLTTGGDLNGANVRGIPHGFLFGADGKLAENDPRGAQLETRIKELLSETAAAMAGPGPYVKLAAAAAQIKTGRGLGPILKSLREKKDSKDADEAKEAAMMFEALNGAATRMLESAQGRKTSDPSSAIAALDKLALQFVGDEIGDTAKKEAAAMRADPAVKKELDAAAMWTRIEAMNEKLVPVAGKKDPKSDAFKKKNMPAIQQMMGGCQMIVKTYPGTKAAESAQALMDSYK